MILDFSDSATRDIYNGINSKAARRFPTTIWKSAWRKLDSLNAAHKIEDLLIPPGNRLEALKGTWGGHYSIRVNVQFRIVFKWSDGNAKDVQIIDYH